MRMTLFTRLAFLAYTVLDLMSDQAFLGTGISDIMDVVGLANASSVLDFIDFILRTTSYRRTGHYF